MYICLEGVKGSGKTTIFSLLVAEFERRGWSFSIACPTKPITSNPLYEQFASRFPQLRCSDLFNEYLYALRYRYVALHTNWNLPLVVGDRSIVTSYVTRWHKWKSPRRCIERVDWLKKLMPAPDHVLFLNVSIETIQRRLRQRQDRLYGKEEETLPRIQLSLKAYSDIIHGTVPIPRLSRVVWHMVNGEQTREAVFAACTSIIDRIFEGVNH